ncbi:hypothetical protein OSTOST_05994 [Ostertagia ostertagi]
MHWHLVLLVLIVAILPIKADLSKVVAVQYFNLKTDVTTDITCTGIKKILAYTPEVGCYPCPLERQIYTWSIEGTLVACGVSLPIKYVLDVPLTATSIAQITVLKGPSELPVKNDNQTTTESPKTTEKPRESTTQAAPTTQKAPTLINVTVTVGYLQFQTGQAPTYVNKNTQAVVFAVIEGLLLGAILLVFIYRCYRRSKLRAAGLYPTRDIGLPNPTRNSVYYDNGGTLSYPSPNTRPEIPSYRSPDAQPPLRLDSLSPRPQQPVITPNLMPVTSTQPRPAATTTVTPAPLNYWPDQPQPIKNIMDSDI